jgi:hypothetical protein
MDDSNTVRAVEAELVSNGSNDKTRQEPPSAAMAQVDAADVEMVFARVEQAIVDLPSTVEAIKWRDGLKVVEATAAVLNRRDIRAAAARAVAEVERWIASNNPARPVGRPPKTAGENLGQRPAFSEADGESADASSTVSAEELREIRRAHPDPEDDAALRARMQRIEATGKVVSRRALRQEVERERHDAQAEAASQDAATADEPQDDFSVAVAPAEAAAVPLHVCAPEALCDQAEADSIDAVAVALHSTEESLIAEVISFAAWAVRPAGLVLVQCPVRTVADVMSIGTETDVNDGELMDYQSLLVCIGTGSDDWFPILVFRRRDDDADSAVDDEDGAESEEEEEYDDAESTAGPTLFRAATGSDAWRQVIAAWLPAGSDVWDPCCGSGEVLAGAAAAGMRIVGLDADPANIRMTRAALGERRGRRRADA